MWTVHDGHHHVAEHGFDILDMLAEELNALGAVRCNQNAIAMHAQNGFCHRGDERFIIDDKNRSGALFDLRCIADDGLRLGFFGRREKHSKGRAFADSAGDIDQAAVRFDDTEDGGQTKARTFAKFLRGEEWLVNALDDFRGNAGARVGDGQTNVAAGPGVKDLARLQFLRVAWAQL